MKHFYRFRPAKGLIGSYDEEKAQFEELERRGAVFCQTVGTQGRDEGLKDLFWQGDDIVWRNLLRHYLYCLMVTSYMVGASPATFARSLCDPIVHQMPHDLPEAPVRAVYKDICDGFFGQPNHRGTDRGARRAGRNR
ncbi:MAG TPA: hypothetical protein VGJ20_21615 [Xanthobacteraceae bacterium]